MARREAARDGRAQIVDHRVKAIGVAGRDGDADLADEAVVRAGLRRA
jgi:hypothetical protein